MGERMRAMDWTTSPLGPVAGWAPSLRSALSLCLGCGFPTAIYWGNDLALLYNDAWSRILAGKHPWALGRAGKEVWPEIWTELEPIFAQVFATAEPVRSRDHLLSMHRRGFTEECYFDFSLSPIRDEAGVVRGVFNAVLETTAQVLGERRLRLLRDLAAVTAEAPTVAEACKRSMSALIRDPADVPYALIVLKEGDATLRLAAMAGFQQDPSPVITDPRLLKACRNVPSEGVVIEDAESLFGPAASAHWPEPVQRALVLPLAGDRRETKGCLIIALSPRLVLDEEYRDFLSAVAMQVAAAMERGRADEAETASRSHTEFILRASGIGTWILDLRTHDLTCSDVCRASFDIQSGEPFTYETLGTMIHPEDRAFWHQSVMEAIEQNRDFQVDSRIIVPSGEPRWIQVKGHATYDAAGTPQHLSGVTQNITERKIAEERLRDAQRRLAATMTAASVGTWVWDVVEDKVVADASLAEIFGIKPGQTEGGSLQQFMAAIHPDDVSDVQQVIALSVRTGEPYEAEYRLRRSEGGWRWVNARGTVERDAAGKPLSFNGAVIDISARKRIEEALAEKAAALRDADRRKDEFLAMLAHELRNPLASVSSAVTLLKESNEEESHVWAADVIGRQTSQLARLVDDLLDVSRITQGKIELRLELIDAALVIEHAAQSVAPLVEQRRHTLVTEVPHGELWVQADPTRLEQIILNLLTNAAKYTPLDGHIWLRAQLENTASSSAPEVVITVRDDGMGIEPEQIASMFTLFAQGERSAARSEGGLGIGLTVVRALSEMHGGSVQAESEGAGTGTLFRVRLPAASRPPDNSEPLLINKVLTEGAGRRTLIVDDNQDTASGLGRLLKRRGYAIEVAYEGPAALALASEFCPVIVLLDIGLPGMDGYEVARRLRAEPCGADTLIVAISGYGQQEDRERSKAAGIDHHFVKPVDLEELRRVLVAHFSGMDTGGE